MTIIHERVSSTMKVRLTLRQEGAFWNAYMALPDNMDNAKLIGSVLMGAVMQDDKVKKDFMKVMQQVLALAIKNVTGQKVKDWEITTGPERESQALLISDLVPGLDVAITAPRQTNRRTT